MSRCSGSVSRSADGSCRPYRARDWADYQSNRARFEGLTERRLVVDTAEPLAINVRKVLAYIGWPPAAPGAEQVTG